MPFPFFHITIQSGAIFVVGFFLRFYFLNKIAERPSPLFPLLGEEDFRIKLLPLTKSFPSLEGIEEWVVFDRNVDLQAANKLTTNH